MLYNLNRARETAQRSDRIVLVEGYMDVIGATQAGVTEVVAHVRNRADSRADPGHETAFGESAPRTSIPIRPARMPRERSIKLLLDENLRVRIVELEGGLDPDEYAKLHGAERYRDRIAAAKTYFYWLADRARARYNMREPQGRVDAFQFLLPAIQGLNDKLERVAVANDLAGYLGFSRGWFWNTSVRWRRTGPCSAGRRRNPIPRARPTESCCRCCWPMRRREPGSSRNSADRLT